MFIGFFLIILVVLAINISHNSNGIQKATKIYVEGIVQTIKPINNENLIIEFKDSRVIIANYNTPIKLKVNTYSKIIVDKNGFTVESFF